MQKCRWALILLLGAAFSSRPILSHDAQGSNQPAERVYFSALNKEERPVPGLKAADFELRVNGRPASLEGFRAGLPYGDRSTPLVAWILLSIGPKIDSKAIQRQAGTIAAAFAMLHPGSVMGIKLISDRSETLAPLAHDPQALRASFLQYGERRAELQVGIQNDSVPLGNAGMARALELAVDELDAYVASQPSLQNREVHRAVMIISNGDLNPDYKLKSFYAKAALESVFVYPVYVPVDWYGQWVLDYYELAKKTAGVASVFGAIKPGSKVLPLPQSNQDANALQANFIHMIRDVNGKYSFTILPPPEGQQMQLELRCKVKGIQIRLPRTSLP
ncbi:MAG: hypothetical protein LAP85_13295 [Acidobacteriia bacterium]|nr:hypothetical protein [Terriglobia bacterium]